ncbi:hypothetical protein K402DRAFT_460956 [Aulographum hederae CBS 113979]|uniref:Aminoglycoside phosphotransferase domain-containing protein n=1 Tax=Aulographum hederae CBS 113979 TaxID=1176131 RepID=A0A6G1H9H5_9PEZI|nr:hypothetical protein K402DRAFT_460956 [Aulographum hederae CBS 113979]
MANGSFNWTFKVGFEDGTFWEVRFPILGNVVHAEEKIRREVGVLSFLKERTQVPVPKIIAFGIAFGIASDNHDPEVGPFLITECIEGVTLSMEEIPRPSYGATLRRDITDETLCTIYRQVSKVLLELSKHSFDQIGAPIMVEHSNGTRSWPIKSAPLTLKMNEIEQAGNRLLHISPHFVTEKHNSGPFTLFCDDFRPGNILVNPDTFEILAVIDLEWTYAAPYQFLYSPPKWVIIERTCSWTTHSLALYQTKLQLFLQAFEDEEASREAEGDLSIVSAKRMSALMEQSMEDGKFWFSEMVLDAFNFDDPDYWSNLERHVADRELLGVGIPAESEVEAFVARKLADLEQYNTDLQSLKTTTEEKPDAA